MDREIVLAFHCGAEVSMNIVGGKYKISILWHLIDSTLRYNEIQKAIPQATPKMLSQQLKELEADGIINRTLYPVVPPKTEYSLTELGQTVVPIVKALCEWGNAYLEQAGIPIPWEKRTILSDATDPVPKGDLI